MGLMFQMMVGFACSPPMAAGLAACQASWPEDSLSLLHATSHVDLSTPSAQIDAILDKHNSLRASVSEPCTAADMETMTWDETLASASRAWADQCNFAHDPANQANSWGENLAYSWSSAGNNVTETAITSSIQKWYNEAVDAEWLPDGSGIRSKTYSNPSSECQQFDGTDCAIGHYTQIVWAKTNKVGCAAVTCPSGTMFGNGGFYLVCKYSPAGNRRVSNDVLAPPWTAGRPCASCANECADGALCDAGADPNRCSDKTSFAFTFNAITYHDCASLTTGVSSWCSSYNSQYPYCDLTCGACVQPVNLGFDNCGVLTESTTAAPTASPTPSPTADPTAAPEAPSATGDPHVNNVAGEHFDINQPANHVLLRVPQEPSRPALLELRGQIKADEQQNVCAMYIREVTLRGEWLGNTTVQVRPLRRNEPGSNAAGNTTAWPFSLRVSTASTEGIWRAFGADGSEVQALSASVSVAARANLEEFGKNPVGQAFEFTVGHNAMAQASIIVYQGQRQALNLRLKDLTALGEQRLGGLLGTEKHSPKVEELTQECKASKTFTAPMNLLRTESAASHLSAAW